jgi:hypothetical protein
MIKRHTDFQDMMNVSIETEDKWLNRKLNSHICYGKGGGGGGQQQQDVPPTLRPYVTDVLNRAKALYGAETQYQPYQGERVVPFTAEELAAQEGITGMVGRGISQDPFLSSAGAYYAPAYGLLGEAGALQAGAAREITADEIMGRMSPYQQAVTDITKREAMKEAQLYGQKLKGQAATTGGFGGSRQAILEAQAAADLGGRLTDIQAKGQQEAYLNALAMAEQQRAREAGAGAALSGLSGMYGNLGQQALGQAYRELGYLSGVGEAQRGMGQQRADIAYQDFVAQRDFPDTQLQKYSSLIQGFPFQFNMPGAQPSQFQQTVGAATALGGLGRGLGFFKQGGQIKRKTNYLQGGGLSGLLAPLNYIMPASDTTLSKTLSDRKKELVQQLSQASDIAEAERIKRLIVDVDQRLETSVEGAKQEEIQAQQEAQQREAGISSIQKSLGLPMADLSSMPPAGFTGGTPLPEYPDYLKERDAKDAEKATADAEKILADKDNKADKPTESVEDLEKVLEEAYKFDREAKEKAIKSQQGFDVAALGLQLMSTPLSKIDPRMISQLGVSQKELAGLSEEEAKEKLQKELTRIAIKKSKADTEKTLADAAEARATAGYLSVGKGKDSLSPQTLSDLAKTTASTTIRSAAQQEAELEYSNQITNMLNTDEEYKYLSEEQKELLRQQLILEYRRSKAVPNPEQAAIPAVGRTAGRILG